MCEECSKINRKKKIQNNTPNFKYKEGEFIGVNKIKLIKYTKKVNGHWFGKFLCPYPHDTPQYFECNIDSVVQGRTKSCGCQRYIHSAENGKKRGQDLTGKKFGKLTVIKDSGKRNGGNHVLWECKCSCEKGETIFLRTDDLISGKIICCQQRLNKGRSSGEVKINTALTDLKINFKQEYVFQDCRNPKTNMPFRFDFYLPDYNCCIEYDGEQHFIETDMCNDTLEERIEKDTLKDEYCKENNIIMIRIPYWDLKKINKNYITELLNNPVYEQMRKDKNPEECFWEDIFNVK